MDGFPSRTMYETADVSLKTAHLPVSQYREANVSAHHFAGSLQSGRFAIKRSVILAVQPSPPRSRVRPDACLQRAPHRFLDAPGRPRLANMLEHHCRRPQEGDRIGHALAGDVRSAAVDRLEQRITQADVRAGNDAQAADQTGAQDRSSRRRTGFPSPARHSRSGREPSRGRRDRWASREIR